MSGISASPRLMAKPFFFGCGTTVDTFPVVVRPPDMPPTTCAPVMMDDIGCGHNIAGEVFKIDDSTLEAMDILEGVKAGFYYKRQTKVVMEEQREEVLCIAYFFPSQPELMKLPLIATYGDAEHSQFRPPPLRSEIADLCKPRRGAGHVLQTSAPCALQAHCLRLLPGQDILESLLNFVAGHRLPAVAVLTCVGSTAKTTLRPAGKPESRVFEDKFEIVSLTGTLSQSGHHLHMSISDPECRVFGGHVLHGCIVRTTAEIVLGLLDGVRFTRPLDDRTGYDELSINSTKRQRFGTVTENI